MNCPKCFKMLDTSDCYCPECAPKTINTITNVTYIWICPECGRSCSMRGFVKIVVGGQTPQLQPPIGWKCPSCGRFHSPYVGTCPFCQPAMLPYFVSPIPYFVDPIPYFPYLFDIKYYNTADSGSYQV